MSGTEFALVFAAGVVSFLSPCVLPLVPVYLSIATGLGWRELTGAPRRPLRAVARGGSMFVLGFSAVFVALGLSATAVGAGLARHQVPIARVAGVVVLTMAVLMLVNTWGGRSPLQKERRFHPRLVGHSPGTALLAGAAFGFGWTPCIGPVLGSVLAVAASNGEVLRGGALLATYSGGLAVPLLITGLAFHNVLGLLQWSRRHALALTRTAASVLAVYGILLVIDRLSWISQNLQSTLVVAR